MWAPLLVGAMLGALVGFALGFRLGVAAAWAEAVDSWRRAEAVAEHARAAGALYAAAGDARRRAAERAESN